MKIAILGTSGGWHAERLLAAAASLGHEARLVEFRRLVAEFGGERSSLRLGEFDLTRVDRVIVRGVPPGTLEQIVFRMDALHRLARMGIPLVNGPAAIECCVDKYLATARLTAANLPAPRTIVCENAADAMEAYEALGRDVVLKPLFGSEGRGILRIDQPALAERVFASIGRLGEVFYLQEFVRHPGHDFRALVLGGRVLAAMRRIAHGDFRTNVAKGGGFERAVLTDEAARLAVDAARAVGAEFAGVDLLPGPDGALHILEVNSAPGFEAISKTTTLDIARELILHVTEALGP